MYAIRSYYVTGGTDAQGECTVRLTENGREALGQGAHSDIIVASAKAFLSALNKILVSSGKYAAYTQSESNKSGKASYETIPA